MDADLTVESPSQPWLSRSSGGTTPSPASLVTPDSSASSSSGRRSASLETLELLDGLAEDFDSTSLARGTLSASPATEEITVKAIGMETLEPEVDHKGHVRFLSDATELRKPRSRSPPAPHGQIEYKLKLLRPHSLHRLEKLRTQLKWRLVEGGGVAVYELGLLDDGTLVGLVQDDMDESLRTLGQMLAGLGGGSVQVTRVVRLGSGPSSTSSSASASSSPSPSPSTSTSPGALFPSFDVSADTDDLAFLTSTHSLSSTPPPPIVTDPLTGAISIFPPPRVRGPTPVPNNRTPDEQAELRRLKRDARRQMRREGPAKAPGPPHGAWPIQVATHPLPVPPRDKPPKPPKPPRARARSRCGGAGDDKGSSSSGSSEGDVRNAVAAVPPARPRPTRPGYAPRSPHGGDSLYKPAMLKEGDTEVRYVLEAVVTKATAGAGAGGGTPEGAAACAERRRRKSSAARRPESTVDAELAALELLGLEDEEAEDDEAASEDDTLDVAGEGWSFLEFDLEQLASSVKSAAAAAAAAEGGRGARAPGARRAAAVTVVGGA